MSDQTANLGHSHVFLGSDHERSERRTWWVIWLCASMMVLEIAGGVLFGSIALVADGLHMSTHAGALLLAALAYRYARKYANDTRFSFGTGKFGDLAGFTSAIILAMIALLIGYEAVRRFFLPVPIDFAEALPIAGLGLVVNVVSALLLAGGHDHHHGHGHGHRHDHSHGLGGGHAHGDHNHDVAHHLSIGGTMIRLEIAEDGVPPRFRLSTEGSVLLSAPAVSIETIRPDGRCQSFAMQNEAGCLESRDVIPEPHEFTAIVSIGCSTGSADFVEHEHAHEITERDNNMRAAVIHVATDAAVSILVIVGLLLARVFGWLWMDPAVGIAGAFVIATWAFGLIRDTGAILLDMTPDRRLAQQLRDTIEVDGDELADLHLWRLGPGHLGAILSICSVHGRSVSDYRQKLTRFKSLSHLTIEVQPR